MTAGAIPRLSPLQRRIAGVIAATLRIPVDIIWPNEPLAGIGMDSLGAVETAAALEDELGVELPVTLMHEYPDLQSLCAFIESGMTTRAPNPLERMRADAVLPRDIRPGVSYGGMPTHRTRDARNVLLTGATGFVGAHLLRRLVDETDATIHCLVRPSAGDPATRVRERLVRFGLWCPAVARRLRIVRGDLGAPSLGLSYDTYQRLTRDVDAIYHAGADVNWVRSYDALRATNVAGTIEVLRFACTNATKPVHFLSSVAVCHSTTGPRIADERTNPLDAIDGLQLGYAQSKCVAEALVREAGARGVPVTILRSSLVTGDSVYGRSNPDDLVSRFIAGCIAMHAAPDLDWRMDCVPVDEVVSSVVRLSRAHNNGVAVAHLAADQPRHWRECVLWMRLRGYDVELMPYRQWMDVLRSADAARNPLHTLRSFFLHTFAANGDLTLPELFEESRRASVSNASTRHALADLHVSPRPIGARLLARYFDDLERSGAIPPPPSDGGQREQAGAKLGLPSHPEEAGAKLGLSSHPEEAGAKLALPSHPEEAGAMLSLPSHPEEAEAMLSLPSHPEEAGAKRSATEGSLSRQGSSPPLVAALTDALGGWLAGHSLRLESVALTTIDSDESIVAELTACRAGRANHTGLYSATLAVVGPHDDRHEIKAFVKSKTADLDVIDVAHGVAALASTELGNAVAEFSDHLGFTRCHVRELALYSHPDPRLRRNMPDVLAVHRDDDAGEWIVALESIDNAFIMNAADDCSRWTDEAIEAAIAGLARIHAVGFERREEFSAAMWSAPRRDAHQRVAMTPLWSALATHACEQSPSWSDRILQAAHQQLVTDVGSWSRALDVSPQTLIHNDFNSRNIAIRGKPGALSLCAFDWELATMGVPQRDLVELLCFVLPTDAPPATIAHWLERHRALLERETELSFRADAWDIGFRAALCDLLVDRFASYAMVDRIRRQTYLSRVVQGWANIYQHYPWIPVTT